eukprot:scaffold650_cov249-Pinguiococcus_pyrenoidosus.AAC.21
MVADAVVLPVVRPDLLAAGATAYLALPLCRHGRPLLFELHFVEPIAQHLHRQLLVLELTPLLGAEDADPGGLVDQIDRSLDLVDILATRPARACSGQADVFWVDLDSHFIDLSIQEKHKGKKGRRENKVKLDAGLRDERQLGVMSRRVPPA